MRQRLRSSLTYANVMATLAVFLVLGGGTALGAYVVSSNSQIGPNTVSGHKPPLDKHANIIGGSINGTDLAASAVTGPKIAANAVTGAKVLNDSLTRDDINEATLSGVTPGGTAGGDLTGTYPNPSVADGAITPAKLNAGLSFTDAGLPTDDCTGHDWDVRPNNVPGYSNPSYARDPFGIVHLRGVAISCVAQAGVMFTLPPGFRPAARELFLGMRYGGGGILRWIVQTNGDVQPTNFDTLGQDDIVSISGITFRCAPSGQNGCP
jgi:hypothetical protein